MAMLGKRCAKVAAATDSRWTGRRRADKVLKHRKELTHGQATAPPQDRQQEAQGSSGPPQEVGPRSADTWTVIALSEVSLGGGGCLAVQTATSHSHVI